MKIMGSSSQPRYSDLIKPGLWSYFKSIFGKTADMNNPSFSYTSHYSSCSSINQNGVLATNGCFYIPPVSNYGNVDNNIQKFNPLDGITTSIGSITIDTTLGGWKNGALAPNGKIYFLAANNYENRVLVVNPADDTNYTISASNTSNDCILAADGYIYSAPYNGVVAKFTPQNETYETLTYSTGENCNCIRNNPDGNLYAFGLNESVMKIDITSQTVSQVAAGGGTETFQGAILAPNTGIFYIGINNTGNVMKFDPSDNSLIGTNIAVGRTAQIFLAPNGKIYICPIFSTSVMYEIDPADDSYITNSSGVNGTFTVFLGGDKIYALFDGAYRKFDIGITKSLPDDFYFCGYMN